MQSNSSGPTLRKRILGCFAGVAIGDAIGVPWENYRAEDILKMTGGAGVTDLQDLPAGIERKFKDARGIALGETSDDWQLTRVVAESLIRSRGFDLIDQALAHVAAFEKNTRGWGGSTRDSIAEIKEWFDSRGARGRNPRIAPAPKKNRGLGNGVIMKIAPLACWLHWANRRAPREWDSFYDLGEMTHSDPEASACASFVARILNHILNGTNSKDLAALVIAPGPLPHQFYDPDARREILKSAELLREVAGSGFLARETAAFAFGTFLRQPRNFRAAILEAVNAGGDTDTNASVVGALVGASVGLDGIPAEWIKAIPAVEHEAIPCAEALMKAAAF
ncbi:MAG TPA: ADP-ribosylglycohydrolase family protein [Patescibacteria group bacterium]|nr:ADP-ribosylglycohydrolase family protein [Patescibacteria group bacterium]